MGELEKKMANTAAGKYEEELNRRRAEISLKMGQTIQKEDDSRNLKTETKSKFMISNGMEAQQTTIEEVALIESKHKHEKGHQRIADSEKMKKEHEKLKRNRIRDEDKVNLRLLEEAKMNKQKEEELGIRKEKEEAERKRIAEEEKVKKEKKEAEEVRNTKEVQI